MISLGTKQKWTSRIEYCIEHQDKLDDWELGFMESIDDRWNSCGMDLTIKQSFRLGEIFHRLDEGE